MERNEAIEVVKRNYPHVTESGSQFETALRTLIPELKESEDEKIRQYLIKCFTGTVDCAPNIKGKDVLAWLEKQGEQNPILPKWKYKNDNTPLLRDSLILNKYGCVAKSPSGALVSDVWVMDYDELAKLPKEELEKQSEQKPTDKIEPKFKAGDIIRHKKQGFTCKIIAVDTEYRLSGGTHLPFDFQDAWELVEQKPAWSEEDEEEFHIAIETLAEAGQHDSAHWLKSLKERYTWKPSDEQMRILNEVLNFAANHENPHWNDYIFGTLHNLIRQLKKLK